MEIIAVYFDKQKKHLQTKCEQSAHSLYLTDNTLRRHYTDQVTGEVYGNNSCLFLQTKETFTYKVRAKCREFYC
jgi:hypothetical protein